MVISMSGSGRKERERTDFFQFHAHILLQSGNDRRPRSEACPLIVRLT